MSNQELVVEFDDIVDQGADGKWSQVCPDCKSRFGVDVSGEIDDGFICGVLGCDNCATHYVDFE